MDAIFIITAFIILLYFSYPFWLKMISLKKHEGEQTRKEIEGVSLILLSYNGKQFLEEKIGILLEGLKVFPRHEMIIVDDASTDGSNEILMKFQIDRDVKIILKDNYKGIPHSMNLAVSQAKYEVLIFCDQRQVTSGDIIQKLVGPLEYEEIGAVSACISHIDKSGCGSVIRRYENFLKAGESAAGSLMGVYGPLYAMKKDCYTPIPEPIILDDLYLSLKVMAGKKIGMAEECLIYDEHICSLHDYHRIKRYLSGFVQILSDRSLLRQLPARQMTMLIWHKYLRLLIPILLCLCYFSTGILSVHHHEYLVPFVLLTVAGIASLTPVIFRLRNVIVHFIRINVLYVLAMVDLLFSVNKLAFYFHEK